MMVSQLMVYIKCMAVSDQEVRAYFWRLHSMLIEGLSLFSRCGGNQCSGSFRLNNYILHPMSLTAYVLPPEVLFSAETGWFLTACQSFIPHWADQLHESIMERTDYNFMNTCYCISHLVRALWLVNLAGRISLNGSLNFKIFPSVWTQRYDKYLTNLIFSARI